MIKAILAILIACALALTCSTAMAVDNTASVTTTGAPVGTGGSVIKDSDRGKATSSVTTNETNILRTSVKVPVLPTTRVLIEQ